MGWFPTTFCATGRRWTRSRPSAHAGCAPARASSSATSRHHNKTNTPSENWNRDGANESVCASYPADGLDAAGRGHSSSVFLDRILAVTNAAGDQPNPKSWLLAETTPRKSVFLPPRKPCHARSRLSFSRSSRSASRSASSALCATARSVTRRSRLRRRRRLRPPPHRRLRRLPLPRENNGFDREVERRRNSGALRSRCSRWERAPGRVPSAQTHPDSNDHAAQAASSRPCWDSFFGARAGAETGGSFSTFAAVAAVCCNEMIHASSPINMSAEITAPRC